MTHQHLARQVWQALGRLRQLLLRGRSSVAAHRGVALRRERRPGPCGRLLHLSLTLRLRLRLLKLLAQQLLVLKHLLLLQQEVLQQLRVLLQRLQHGLLLLQLRQRRLGRHRRRRRRLGLVAAGRGGLLHERVLRHRSLRRRAAGWRGRRRRLIRARGRLRLLEGLWRRRVCLHRLGRGAALRRRRQLQIKRRHALLLLVVFSAQHGRVGAKVVIKPLLLHLGSSKQVTTLRRSRTRVTRRRRRCPEVWIRLRAESLSTATRAFS